MFVTADPLGIQTDAGTVVLDTQIELDPQRGKRGISVSPLDEGNKATIQFDFLNPGEGFIVRILHTCANPEVEIFGSLKGAKLVQSQSVNRSLRLRMMGASFFSVLVLISMFVAISLVARELNVDSFWSTMTAGIIAAGYLLFCSHSVSKWLVLNGQPRNLVALPTYDPDPLD